MMNKFHKAQDEAKEMRRRFTEVENKRIKAMSEKSPLEDLTKNQGQKIVELQAQLSQMKDDHVKAIEALRDTQAEQIEALEELAELECRDRESKTGAESGGPRATQRMQRASTLVVER